MVPADPAAAVLERLAALPHGARLLAVLAEPRAVTRRGEGRRGPRVDGPLTGLHLVGGAVRDLLRGAAPVELDLVAEADGPGAADELRRRLDGVGHVHERFGTASVALPDGTRIDVATARAEEYARPGALPDVRPGTLDEDMRRRDFTVNAVAVGVSPDRRGALHHAPGALDDLAAGRLRVLHDASFTDDPTRLLRLVRYAARLGFAIAPGTEALARAAFAAGAPATAGVARMGGELKLLVAEPEAAAVRGLALLRDLAGARPAAVLAPDFVVDPPLLERALALLPPDGDRSVLLLAGLTHRAERGQLRGWLAAIHLPRPGPVLDAADDPAGLATAMRAADRPSALHALLHRRAPEAVALAGAFGAEAAARRWLGELRHVRLAIAGGDLLAAGVPRGPELGERLRRALERKLDEGLTTQDQELAAALGAPAP
jgi:tRNA nucleotidyltransferase (CCA-adding enzyme)